jgi:hypothetical protein
MNSYMDGVWDNELTGQLSTNDYDPPVIDNDDVPQLSESNKSTASSETDESSTDEYDSDGFCEKTFADDIRSGTR